MNDKTLRRLTRGAGVLVVLVVLWAIQVVRPDFYTTMLSLTVEGDINGMTAYMASFGYKAIFISAIMVAFVNAIGIPSVLFLTVNGVIFGLIPGILISWAGEVIEHCFAVRHSDLSVEVTCSVNWIHTAVFERLWPDGPFRMHLM